MPELERFEGVHINIQINYCHTIRHGSQSSLNAWINDVFSLFSKINSVHTNNIE